MSRVCDEQDRRACSFALWQIGIAGAMVGATLTTLMWLLFEMTR